MKVEEKKFDYDHLPLSKSDQENLYWIGKEKSNQDIAKQIHDRICEMRVMQIQASDDYEFCEQIEYAIMELKKILS